MTVSIRRISAGAGYRYFMESVAVGDGERRMSDPLTRYYAERGTPPGRWMGTGLAACGLSAGAVVTEEQMFQLIGMCANPVTGDALGRAPLRAATTYAERVRARLAELSSGLEPAVREARVERIQAEERERAAATAGRAVAGFDLTFSVPKSVSAVWAVADAPTQALIAKAHHDAIADALAFAEREIFATRMGAQGVAQVPVRGVLAAAFDHPDSRANDPHLHTHVVVANRVQAVSDGKWRTLDSKALFKATVALSELHQGLLMDRLTAALGVDWDARARQHSTKPQYEIVGVPDALRAEFSRRAGSIEVEKNRLVEKFRARHGREPSKTTVLRLRQQATLATRPDKRIHSLADLTAQWRDRARRHVGEDTERWARSLRHGHHRRALRVEDLDTTRVQRLAEQVLGVVADQRATFGRWNVYAEAARQLQPLRFATAGDREQATARVTDSALGLSVLLTAPELAHTPEAFRRPDGSSQFRHVGADRYTTTDILAAEDRLLAAGRDTTGPLVPAAAVDTITADPLPGKAFRLTADQAAAIRQIATSGRVLDVLVGAAGTGKTAAMAGLAAAWQARHGPGSVLGLAPSATAAEVLAAEVGLPADNTAKWLTEQQRQPTRRAQLDALRAALSHVTIPNSLRARRLTTAIADIEGDLQRWQLHPGQLVILDEASLAGTLTVDAIAAQARAVGAKLLLVGDHAQLSAVQAGGAFSLLTRDRETPPQLHEIRRFTQDWEKVASLHLRAGDPAALDTYARHQRIRDGDRDAMLDAAYTAWLADHRAGKRSLLIAADRDTVTDLNARARTDLMSAGLVAPCGVRLADGTHAGLGDTITTRRNDRSLIAGRGWVRNGDQWQVIAEPGDGSLQVQRRDARATVTLPAEYVAAHVDLGYATTAHRAQGRTVDTAHAIVTSAGMTRETLYVALTRGTDANHVYVATDHEPDPDTSHGPTQPGSWRNTLTAVLSNLGADESAHGTMRAELETAGSWTRLAAEYDTIAAVAQHDRWWTVLSRSLPTDLHEQVAGSPALGALMTGLRCADAHGLDIEQAVARLAADQELATAEDVAAMLHDRVEQWAATADPVRPAQLIAGLHPTATDVTDPGMRRALNERATLLEQRARALAEQAVADRVPWVRLLGEPPTDPTQREAYLRALTTVAAYRDRWNITTVQPLDKGPGTDRAADRAVAQQAVLRARRLATRTDPSPGKIDLPRAGMDVRVERSI